MGVTASRGFLEMNSELLAGLQRACQSHISCPQHQPRVAGTSTPRVPGASGRIRRVKAQLAPCPRATEGAAAACGAPLAGPFPSEPGQ